MEQATNHTQGATPACASCKHQRKKCGENCILAPFFPTEKNRNFQAVHKIFGVSNLQKRIKDLDPNLRQNAANAMVWEAFCWHRDPINGAYGEFTKLYDVFNMYKNNCICHYQHPMVSNMTSTSSPVVEWNDSIHQMTRGNFNYHDQNDINYVNHQNENNVHNNKNGNMGVENSFTFVSNHQNEGVENQFSPPLQQSNPINNYSSSYWLQG